jgi:hypothetical protein
MFDLGSAFRGIQVMKFSWLFKGWAVKRLKITKKERKEYYVLPIWFHFWTPIWHERRGPYISIGLYFFAIYKGY